MTRLFVILSLVGLLGGCAGEAGSSTQVKSDPEAGFVPLLNGRDLAGWFYSAKAGEGYRYREDGTLYCTAKDGGTLLSEKEYADFALRFEFKLTPGANNGIAIRTPRAGNAAYQGMEIQVLDDSAEKYGKLRPEQYHGGIYDVIAPRRGHLKPVGEWNEQEITARGRRITVTLNGQTIVDADLDVITDAAKLKKHPGLGNKSGHIGFLGHGAEVEFRNVRVKEL